MLGEEVEGGRKVDLVGSWWCEVEGEESMVDGLGGFIWIFV